MKFKWALLLWQKVLKSTVVCITIRKIDVFSCAGLLSDSDQRKFWDPFSCVKEGPQGITGSPQGWVYSGLSFCDLLSLHLSRSSSAVFSFDVCASLGPRVH